MCYVQQLHLTMVPAGPVSEIPASFESSSNRFSVHCPVRKLRAYTNIVSIDCLGTPSGIFLWHEDPHMRARPWPLILFCETQKPLSVHLLKKRCSEAYPAKIILILNYNAHISAFSTMTLRCAGSVRSRLERAGALLFYSARAQPTGMG